MRAFLGASLAALLAAVASGGATGASPRGGLHGTVTKGPLTPVCRVGVPCEGPAAGLRLLFLRNGAVVARTTTRADGRYRIALRPGRYAVRAGPGRTATHPATASVPHRGFRRVDLFVDTRIR